MLTSMNFNVTRFTCICVIALLLLRGFPLMAACPAASTTVILGDIVSSGSAMEGARVVSALALEDINNYMKAQNV